MQNQGKLFLKIVNFLSPQVQDVEVSLGARSRKGYANASAQPTFDLVSASDSRLSMRSTGT